MPSAQPTCSLFILHRLIFEQNSILYDKSHDASSFRGIRQNSVYVISSDLLRLTSRFQVLSLSSGPIDPSHPSRIVMSGLTQSTIAQDHLNPSYPCSDLQPSPCTALAQSAYALPRFGSPPAPWSDDCSHMCGGSLPLCLNPASSFIRMRNADACLYQTPAASRPPCNVSRR